FLAPSEMLLVNDPRISRDLGEQSSLMLFPWRYSDCNRSKQAVALIKWSSRKEQCSCRTVGGVVAGAMSELERPKTIDLNWPALCRMHQPNSFVLTVARQACRIKNMNSTIPKVADEQVAAEPTKTS